VPQSGDQAKLLVVVHHGGEVFRAHEERFHGEAACGISLGGLSLHRERGSSTARNDNGPASFSFSLPTDRYKQSIFFSMIRKLQSGEYRLYSRKKDAKTGKRKNLGTFSSRAAAQKHERAVQYFKRA
jgi:hypothetical protein